MTFIELIVLIIIAAVAGAVGQSLGGYKSRGFLTAAVLGFIGALLGSWLAENLGLPNLIEITIGGIQFPLVWSIVGAAILVALGGVLGARGFKWGITPPTKAVLLISILLAVLALLVNLGVLTVSISAAALLASAYILLLLGNFIEGL